MSKVSSYISRKRWLRNLLIGILIVVTIGGAVGGVIALSRNTDKIDDALTYKSIGATKFSLGGLNDSGVYVDSKKSICTKNAFDCQGLNISLQDKNVSYNVYFYDDKDEFIYSTGSLSVDFSENDMPIFAKSAKVVITPESGKNLNIFGISKYAKKVKITVFREQSLKCDRVNFTITDKKSTLNGLGEITSSTKDSQQVTDYIDITGYSKVLIKEKKGNSSDCLWVFNKDKVYKSMKYFVNVANLYWETQDYNYYLLDLNFDDVKYVRLNTQFIHGMYFIK